FNTPQALRPALTAGGYNYDGDGNVGRRTNRGFEGLAISPDGQYTFAMLQSAMVDEGGANGVYNRIVKFDNASGEAVAQYAYRMETAAQGRGISALV
ncbi:esterase-like activity of phytase family protein, partial [Klebsiella variicola]|uniref:esterase-like activity of phytase family protein n=2 Tax=Pseudomonadota TaxID=1224 RepID=UPI001F1C9ED3